MKKIISILYFLNQAAFGQQLNQLDLAKAYELALQNYPLVKQRDLVKQTASINIDNLSKAFLPQAVIGAQATYQSEVTQIKVSLPGFSFDPLSRDQYKFVADVNQLLYDGGVIKQQRQLQQLNETVEQQKIEVELYKVKERINQLFLGILFFDGQLKQVDLVKNDLNNGIKKVDALVKNGVVLRSNLDVLQAELLKTTQRSIELKSSRKGLIDVLGLFINRPLPETLQLERPTVDFVIDKDALQRPEMKLFSSQEKYISGQNKLIESKNLPKASLFAQGGYGKPGLNFLKNDFNLFYVTGVRLNWSVGGLYTQKKEKQLLEVNKKMVDVQRETFMLNTNTALKQQQSEIEKMDQLIASDNQIIELREKVKEAAKSQLENAVITSNDFLREVNAEDQARQSLLLHQLQLLQAKINYQTILGKQ